MFSYLLNKKLTPTFRLTKTLIKIFSSFSPFSAVTFEHCISLSTSPFRNFHLDVANPYYINSIMEMQINSAHGSYLIWFAIMNNFRYIHIAYATTLHSPDPFHFTPSRGVVKCSSSCLVLTPSLRRLSLRLSLCFQSLFCWEDSLLNDLSMGLWFMLENKNNVSVNCNQFILLT